MANKTTKDVGGGNVDNPSSFQRGKNHLLAIAIDEYPHFPPLSNCVKDAKGFIKVLKNRYGFADKNITPLFDGQATLDQITLALDEFSDKVEENDNVIIYFSGHGYYKKSQSEGFLIPFDGEKEGARYKYSKFMSNANLLNHIRGIKSQHTFLIVDCCFSGSLFFTPRGGEDDYLFEKRTEAFSSRWGLAAGRIEKVDDGFHGENSPFAKALITFLQKNMERKFAVSDLIRYVKKVTTYNATQTPIGGPLFKVGDMAGEFVFHLDKEDPEYERTLSPIQNNGNQTPPKRILPSPPENKEAMVLVEKAPADYSAKELEKLLIEGHFEIVFSALEHWQKEAKNLKYKRDEIIILQSRYHSLVRQSRMGTIGRNQKNLERNRITMSVLSLVRRMEGEE